MNALPDHEYSTDPGLEHHGKVDLVITFRQTKQQGIAVDVRESGRIGVDIRTVEQVVYLKPHLRFLGPVPARIKFVTGIQVDQRI